MRPPTNFSRGRKRRKRAPMSRASCCGSEQRPETGGNGMKRFLAALALVVSGFVLSPAARTADDKYITVASTTSTENSGLFTYLLPAFTKATGIEVRVV